MSLTPISIGQDVMIVIGEHLNKEEIQSYFHKINYHDDVLLRIEISPETEVFNPLFTLNF